MDEWPAPYALTSLAKAGAAARAAGIDAANGLKSKPSARAVTTVRAFRTQAPVAGTFRPLDGANADTAAWKHTVMLMRKVKQR